MEEINKIRCFVCIDLPREIIKEVERVQGEIKKKNIFSGKFTEGENLHLTLKFLGEIDNKKIKELEDKLKEIKFEKFEAYLGELGVFSSDFIRIVWLRILGRQILELQEEIDLKMKEAGFKKEERFMSHLTIARVKKIKDKKTFLEELKKISVKNLGFKIERFYLMKSELKPEGPVYSVLESFEMD